MTDLTVKRTGCLNVELRWIWLGVIALFMPFSENWVQAQSEKASLEVRIPELVATKHVRTNVNDLSLPAGKECLIELTMINQTPDPIRFDSVRTSCNCSQVEVTKNVLQPDQPTKVRLIWKTPAESGDGRIVTALDFLHQGELALNLVVYAKLAGMLQCGPLGIGESQADGFVLWRLPIAWTEPVSLEQLTVVRDANLADVVAEVVAAPRLNEDDATLHRGFVKFALPRVMLEQRGETFGTFKVVHEMPKVEIERSATFSARPLMKVSPTMVEFRAVPDDDRFVEASVMVQLDRAYFPSDRTKEVELMAHIHGVPAELHSRHLGNSVYRVKLRAAAGQLPDTGECEVAITAGIDSRRARFLGVGFRE